ncbi:GNAT family N-acetyltransferase [Paenibacillus sp. Soil522]|uniref:GNAT family N-acetyltransferase n=1 Tax=Paenibacillus sp. Soil522 TaxID=1736388 RepID=UPI0006F4DF04|nr:GNAT family N-acetyltransferase [Paenibacillus sp. Soil522]KRE29461.1 GNAT family acetyltransferase [Paenibacillus sp. Soil522]
MVSIIQMKLDDSYKIRDIDRTETIELIYKCKDGVLEEIKAGHECPNWKEDNYQEIISRYEDELTNGGTAYGAFDGDKLVGFGVLAHKFRGSENNQLQIDLMYVTRNYRRQGIGRQIMDLLSKVAIEKGAKYLYISSTETESAVKFYSSCGSTLTSEIDEELFEKEPYDIHMLKKLPTT